MFAKLNNGQLEKFPYTLGMLRKDNPNVSFPKTISDEMLAEYNVVPISTTNRPEDHTKNYESTATLVNGSWIETWVASDASQDEINERTIAQASSIRLQRNDSLSSSDWTQLQDATVNQQEWATYRQSLRDIPSQEGFPWDVTWPTQPE